MNKLRRKPADTRGATFVFALVIFLITCMFSMTIVNAALSGTENAGDLRKSQQEFLTVTSAAGLLRSEVERHPLVKGVYEDADGKLRASAPDGMEVSTNSAYGDWQRDGSFHAAGTDATNEIYDTEALYAALRALADHATSASADPFSTRLTVSASAEGGGALADVNVDLQDMDGSFGFTAVLTAGKTTMTLRFRSTITPDTDGERDRFETSEEVPDPDSEEEGATKTVTETSGYRRMYHLEWVAETVG